MSSLKDRYERFGDFMQQNTKGVEVFSKLRKHI